MFAVLSSSGPSSVGLWTMDLFNPPNAVGRWSSCVATPSGRLVSGGFGGEAGDPVFLFFYGSGDQLGVVVYFGRRHQALSFTLKKKEDLPKAGPMHLWGSQSRFFRIVGGACPFHVCKKHIDPKTSSTTTFSRGVFP